MFKFFLLLSIFVSALLSSTNITMDKKGKYDNFEVLYLKDNNSNLTIETISKKEFNKKTPNNFTLGYTNATVWFKFDLENESLNEHFVLTLNESFYEEANLYYYDEKWIKKSNGVFNLIKNREIKTNHLAFNLTLQPDKKRTFYLELKGKYAYFGNLEIYEKSHFYFHNTIGVNSFYIFVLGVILIIVLFNLFLYIKTKEKVYIYYVGYSFFNILYILNISGLLVYLNLQSYIYDLQISAAFMIGFLVLFSHDYLETKTYFPKLSKFFKTLAIPFFILGVLVVFSYQPWNKFINNFAGLICIFLIVLSIIIFLKGHNKTKYYIFAMLLYFTFVILFTFMVNGTLEYSNLTRYGFLVATTFEVVIFSFILANRYNDIKENIQHYLEIEVENRTSKLNSLLKERELLLKEVYHRVKNNFHVVIGMLWFESKKDNSNTQEYKELINRIKSMSMIHEYLYNSKDLVNINTREYLSKIITNIASSYHKNIIQSDIEEILIEFDDAVSLGIVINEVLTNSIKHNKNTTPFSVYVTLKQKEKIVLLTIEDNGIGFHLDEHKKGLGLKLIEQFCQKLPHSNQIFSFENGTKFELQFSTGKAL